jgi:hypothetical protein
MNASPDGPLDDLTPMPSPEDESFVDLESPVADGVDSDELTDIELRIARIQASINLRQRRAKLFSYFFGAFGVVALAFASISGLLPLRFSRANVPALSIGLFIYAMLLVGLIWFTTQTRVSSMLQDLEVLKAKRRITKRSAGTSASNSEAMPLSYFDKLVDINVTNLGAYYTMVKFHANNSFIVTICVATIGFGLIAFGLIVGFYRGSGDSALTYVSTGAGIGTEFISAVFFYLYNRTVRQLKEYHDSLLSVQNVLLSFKIVGDTNRESDRVKMVSKMIEFLLGRPQRLARRDPEPKGRRAGAPRVPPGGRASEIVEADE